MNAMRVAAGSISVAISFALGFVVLVRDVELNALNGWTIALGTLGGLTVAWSDRTIVAGVVTMIAAAVPAMIGGLGFLYVIPVGLALAAERARIPST